MLNVIKNAPNGSLNMIQGNNFGRLLAGRNKLASK